MEKIKLNNQVVSMRKYVKQAKVHVINKLVKQIKLLQNRKGSEAQIQKAKRKAERFLEAVALLKKIKPDDVSKLALLKSKDWKDVLQEKNAALHDRCIAMVANYGAVQKEVEAFYSANTELVLKISDYFTQWEEKNKLSKDSPKTNKMPLEKSMPKSNLKDESSEKNKFKTIVEAKTRSGTENTAITFKISHEDEVKISCILKSDNNEKLVKNAERTEDLPNIKNNLRETEILDDDNEESESDENEESESDENDDEKEIIDNSLNDNGKEIKDSSDEEGNINKLHKSLPKSDPHVIMNNHAKNKLKAIALLNLNKLEGLDEIPVSSIGNYECDQKESSEDETNETFQNKSTDPFFLGHNGEDSNAIESNDSDDNHINLGAKDSAHSFSHKTVKNSFYRKDDQFSPKKSFQKFPHDHKNLSRSYKNGKNYEKSFKRDSFASRNSHNKFQEKTGNNKKDYKLKNKLYLPTDNYGKKQFKNISKDFRDKDNISLRNKVPYNKGNANEFLHPSWQAKRKQKELLSTSFQGKRMVFND